MKKKIIFALSLASLLCLGGLTTITSCDNSASSETQKVKVSLKATEGVTLTGINEEGYNPGDTVTFGVTVSDSTKEVEEVKANDVALTLTKDGNYSFKIGYENVEVSVTLKDKPTHGELTTVTIKEGITNGTVTLSKEGYVEVGSTVEIIAIPDEGYAVEKYFLNGTELDGNSFAVVKGTNEVNVTFVELPATTLYGSVRVLADEISHGDIVAKLEDGTVLTEENRRQPVGTKVLLELTAENECYEINEVKLNDTVLTATDGAYSFTVVEGKNFISADFELSHPGEGLVRLVAPEHAKVVVDRIDDYFKVGEQVTVTLTPDANYTIKSVSVNEVAIEESETDNVYTFEVKEGLNTITVDVASEATGVAFVMDEDWLMATDLMYEAYYVIEGKEYQLETTFTPEGSYDELTFKVNDAENEYLEISDTGLLKVKKAYNSANFTVTVALKSNPDIYDTINVRAVKQSQYSIEELKDNLLKAKEKEISEANKTQLIIEEKAASDTSTSKTTYDFEAYNDKHSITTVTDDEGNTSRYYRGIVDGVFYGLVRENGETSVPYNGEPATITTDNEKEYLEKVNTFGSLEFGYYDVFTGVIDYMYEKTLGDNSIYRYDYSTASQYDAFECTTVTTSLTTYDVSTKIRAENSWGEPYAFDITMHYEFDYLGYLKSATYERKDYDGITDVDQEITSSTAYDLEKYTISLTYDDKGEDPNNYFNINDYFYKDFTPEVYTSRDLTDETKLELNANDQYETVVDSTYYIGLSNISPSTALNDIDEIKATSSNTSVVSSVSSTSNGYLYFDVLSEGETTITIKSKNVTKKIKIVASYLDVTSVDFNESISTNLIAGGEVLLEASVTPDEGIKSSEVEFTIEEDTTGGAKIDSRLDRWGISTEYYLVAGEKAGTITVKATSVANPEVSDTLTFTVKEVPSMTSNLVGKTYQAEWTTFDSSTYNDLTYSYKVTFGNDASNLTATIELSCEESSWYGDPTVTNGVFTATVTQKGSKLEFSNIVAQEGNTLETSELPTSLNISLTDELAFDGLSVVIDGESQELEEFVDITPLLIGKTFTLTWSDYSGDYKMIMTFKNEGGKLLADLDCTSSGYYSEGTGKFTAEVEIKSGSIALTNIEEVGEGTFSLYDIPDSINFTVSDGTVTLSIESSTYPYY